MEVANLFRPAGRFSPFGPFGILLMWSPLIWVVNPARFQTDPLPGAVVGPADLWGRGDSGDVNPSECRRYGELRSLNLNDGSVENERLHG